VHDAAGIAAGGVPTVGDKVSAQQGSPS